MLTVAMVVSPTRFLARTAPHGLPLVRQIVQGGLGRLFGPPRHDEHAHAGDPGLFGLGSASWRVLGEPAAIVGGVRALLVQLLHPHAMAGVADHSSFREDPLGRLRRTSAYVTTTAFGATPEALEVAEIVRRSHRAVRGVAPDGVPYDAADPHLLRWVSIALTSSFLAADRAYAPQPVDAATADAFVAEQARAAALLDPGVDLAALAADPQAQAAMRAGTWPLPLLDEGFLPTDVASLEACLACYEPELAVNAQGREGFRFLLWPPIPAPIKAAYLPMLAGALATLTEPQRRLLGLAGASPLAWPVQAQTRALLAALRLTTGTSPAQQAAARRAEASPTR